jgi:C4-dicarboxylate transporter, DctQ subunit
MLEKAEVLIDKAIGWFEEWSLFLVTFVCLLALFLNVIMRYGFNHTLAWSEELVREVIIYTTFIGCSAAIKNRSMIKIDALIQLVPRLKTPLNFFSHMVTLLFSAIMINLGWKVMLQQAETNQTTLLLEIPLELLFAVMPLMGLMMFVRTLLLMHGDVRQLRRT